MRHIFYVHLAVILLFVVLLALLLTLPAQIHIIYEGRGRNNKGQLRLGIFKGRLGLKIGLPHLGRILQQRALKLTRKKAAVSFKFKPGKDDAIFLVQWRRWRDLLTGIKRSIGVFKRLLHRSVCTRLLWETGFGLDDYAATGMTAGLIWAGKGLIMGTLSRHLRIRPAGVRIAVVPQFGGANFASNLDCILETSLGHIILVAFKLVAIWLIRNPGLPVRGKRYA